jgi:hypothetical protein
MGNQFLDQYSLLHFASGIIAYYWNVSFVNWLIFHSFFEYYENTEFGMNVTNTFFKNLWPGGKDRADSLTNSIGDTVFALLGWIIAYILFRVPQLQVDIKNEK